MSESRRRWRIGVAISVGVLVLLYMVGSGATSEALGLTVILVFVGASTWVVRRTHRDQPGLRESRPKWGPWVLAIFVVEMLLGAVFLVVASFAIVIYYAFSLDRSFSWWLFIGFILLSLALLVWAIRQWTVRSKTSFAIPFLIPLLVPILIAVMNSLPGPLERLIEPDVVGVVAVNNPQGGASTVEVEDGQIVEIPRNATVLGGSGAGAGSLLLFGEDYGRIWYARLILDEQTSRETCYRIAGAAFDQPDAVIILFPGDWHGVGLRLSKRDDFDVGDAFVDSQGVYRMGTEYPEGRFCVDTTGMVFAVR